MPRMIVDVHTHVFPPRQIAERAELARRDAGFAALYADPRARMATAEELLAEMNHARVDRAVAAGFWWRSPALCAEHAAYLLEAAARAPDRLLPFVPLALDEAGAAAQARAHAERGAAGFGEVRIPEPSSEEAATARLAAAVEGLDLPLLVHASEEVGHAYGGKEGGFSPGGLWRLLSEHRLRVIAAHWGGGFPFYALMPEVRTLLAEGRLAFDSAASPLLYEPAVFGTVSDLVGPDHVLWGSDFPLRGQADDRAAVEAAIADPALRGAVLGENARRFLGLG